ncbi:MAG: hypothetical protein HGA36_01820 [Candidatus Moranbacteria bacterium]|nr:hypothetical protein [Candidatus Moranbacteria bacterium]
MFNKKIASEFAIGIIILITIAVIVIFWMQNEQQKSFVDPINVSASKPIDVASTTNNQDVDIKIEDEVCVGHLYEGEEMLTGTYALEKIPGTEKKDWMFKVSSQDVNKLPAAAVAGNGKVASDLLYIADADPVLIEKLKKSTQTKPGVITVKGFYLDCEGVSIVSIAPAKVALMKYINK